MLKSLSTGALDGKTCVSQNKYFLDQWIMLKAGNIMRSIIQEPVEFSLNSAYSTVCFVEAEEAAASALSGS